MSAFSSLSRVMPAALATLLSAPLLTACPSAPTEKPAIGETAVAHCRYTNGFSGWTECAEYYGDAWDADNTADACRGQRGEYTLGENCSDEDVLGYCFTTQGEQQVTRIVLPGDAKDDCASAKRGCEVFGGGLFEPGNTCGGVVDGSDGGTPAERVVFEPPTEICVEPLDGEPGMSEDGQVCTRSVISGCTEPGRKFADYASCDQVLTQRPYYPVAGLPSDVEDDDPRLTDTAYQAELAWVKAEIESCACVCCHSTALAPRGSSQWFIEAEPFFVDSFAPTGLALAAGWVDSVAFGAYDPADNNGFERDTVGLPSSDPGRMKAFFEAELARRGFQRADFDEVPPFGGPLYDQLVYQPEACLEGEGVSADGTVSWLGGPARYVYVMRTDVPHMPTVPPNLDLPEGTLWRVDVKFTDPAIAAGFAYGTAPTGAFQAFPEDQVAPAALESGQEYILYVAQDVGIPLSRCVFTF